MELLADLNLREMSQFFDTFFVLPERLSRGFLAAELSSGDLCLFAFVFFLKAPNAMRFRLLKHLATHPSGAFACPPSPPLVPSLSADIDIWGSPTDGRPFCSRSLVSGVTCDMQGHSSSTHTSKRSFSSGRPSPPSCEKRREGER